MSYEVVYQDGEWTVHDTGFQLVVRFGGVVEASGFQELGDAIEYIDRGGY